VLQARAKVTDQERGEAELKANEARLRLESLSARIMDDHQVVLAEAFANYVRPDDLDLPSLRERLTGAEREMQQLGPVNLAAIDELEEAQEREKFLDRQFTDLTNAKTRLEEVIADLNQVSGKRFEETYREVRRNFQELFRKLFGGGRADLQLELKDEEGNPLDPLEAGLEIMACPPGKNPKIITQLSGGEKALTAIALVFAVYKTKPSPFCILDEVDAPLDEANVDRYIDMVREFTQGSADRPGSQFIVITHRKRTMMRADALYGITQNEPGVSTKISVRFSEVEGHFGKDGELLPTVKGSGPFTG
jgi:chromosome segregation protein